MTQNNTSQPDDKIPSFTPEQSKNLVELAKLQLGKQFTMMTSNLKINVEHLVRFIPVAKFCQRKREEKNLSHKEIAKQLNVPHKKLKAIEDTALHEVKSEILIQYVKFLGIEKEFELWAQENQDILEEISEV